MAKLKFAVFGAGMIVMRAHLPSLERSPSEVNRALAAGEATVSVSRRLGTEGIRAPAYPSNE
jgi:predicted dehydrogenase